MNNTFYHVSLILVGAESGILPIDKHNIHDLYGEKMKAVTPSAAWLFSIGIEALNSFVTSVVVTESLAWLVIILMVFDISLGYQCVCSP